jgi:hypothetical protein
MIPKQTSNNQLDYASKADFCRIFHEQMSSLYLLAWLLSADQARAERCFAAALEDCASGGPVFQEWAESWARRAIVQNAIRIVAPRPCSLARRAGMPLSYGAATGLSPLLQLSAFDRFAYVMAILEKYSDQDCSLLLGCSRAEVIAARARASQQLASSGSDYPVRDANLDAAVAMVAR